MSGGHVALVSDCDYEKLSRHKWHLHTAGYAQRRSPRGGNHKLYMHRVIMDPPDDMTVDHINGVPLDNRRENLRLATKQQQRMNQFARYGKSRFKGVTWHRHSRHIGTPDSRSKASTSLSATTRQRKKRRVPITRRLTASSATLPI